MAELAVHDAEENLRAVTNLGGPVHNVREVFTLTPTTTDADWAAVAERLRAVPGALAGYRETLSLGLEKKLHGGPRPTATFIEQLTEWAGQGRGWFEDFTADGPDALRAELDAAGAAATAAVAELRDWMRDVYASAIEGSADTVGRERYARWSRYYNGTDLDLDEAYAYGWAEYHRLLGEMRTEAEKILPGAATPWVALAHLDEHGTHIEGVEEVQRWLQSVMDEAIEALDGTHFELAERVRKVESRIAPAGAPRRPTTRRRPRTSRGRGAPGCRRWARPGSPSTTWSPPGTTRVCPATISSSRSGRTSRTVCPDTRRASAW